LSRTYSFNTRGDTSSIEIQPYLPKTVNSAAVYFYIVDSVSQKAIEDVLVEMSRTGGVLAGKVIEQEHSDSSGAIVLSMLLNETYELNFYINNQLVYSINMVPTSTTYTVFINQTGGGNLIEYHESRTVVDFLPSTGWLESSGGSISFDVNVFSPTGIISDVNINVFQDGNIQLTYSGANADGNYFIFFINLNSLDSNHLITIDVNVFKTNGITEHYSHSYSIKTPYTYNLMSDLRSAKDILGGDLGVNLIAMFITLFAVAGFGIKVNSRFESLFGVGAIIMFIFVYIGWVNVILYSIAVLGGIAAIIAAKRFG